jgi:hypothetical protein
MPIAQPNPIFKSRSMTQNERREFLKTALVAMGRVAGVGVVGCRWPGAMCYVPAPRKSTSPVETKVLCYKPADLSAKRTIPCPECERTMTVGEMDEILREYNVPLKRIQDQGIDAKLIIPEHCEHCGFGLKEVKFQLEIKYTDRPEPIRIELDNASDLENMALSIVRDQP